MRVVILFLVAATACASRQLREADVAAEAKPLEAAPAPIVEAAPAPEVSMEVAHDDRLEKKRPPPTRKQREILIPEADFERLMTEYPRGFQPDDCTKFCKQPEARTKTDDGKWVYVLRCLLKRNIRDETVFACREDAEDPKKLR